uniref:Uncharacterized protein n=1 Tax=Panagrolaimus sp. ES5 TaxID=591445 RepID=A0AC34FUN9_9BILA
MFCCFYASTGVTAVRQINTKIARGGVALPGGGLETVRQCSCKEVQQCFHENWEIQNCTSRGGSSYSHLEGPVLEFLDKCSTEKSQKYCTQHGNEFISISDFGYIETKNLERNDEHEQLCFNENMIKCFKREGCDIVSHNIVLKKIHYECSKGSMKFAIGLMSKYPELIPQSKIEEAKMEYLKKYNETFVLEGKAVVGSGTSGGNNMINVLSIFCFVALSFMI